MRLKRSLLRKLGSAAAALATGFAGQYAFGATIGGVLVSASTVFTNPTGTVTANASIPINVTFSLAANSPPVSTDAFGNVTGVVVSDISPFVFVGASGVNLATDTLRIRLGRELGCAGTFMQACPLGPPYDFAFGPTPFFPTDFSLQPGASLIALFGTFNPTAGAAPPGVYTLPDVAISINVTDLSLPNQPLIAIIDLADTTSQKAFTRTAVTASTPEPVTWLLLLGGLALVKRTAAEPDKAVRMEPLPHLP